MTKPRSDSLEGRARVLIDKKLEKSGWTVIKEGNRVPDRGNLAVEEVQTDAGPMDYGLIADGVLVGKRKG